MMMILIGKEIDKFVDTHTPWLRKAYPDIDKRHHTLSSAMWEIEKKAWPRIRLSIRQPSKEVNIDVMRKWDRVKSCKENRHVIAITCNNCGHMELLPFKCHSDFCPKCASELAKQRYRKYVPKDHQTVVQLVFTSTGVEVKNYKKCVWTTGRLLREFAESFETAFKKVKSKFQILRNAVVRVWFYIREENDVLYYNHRITVYIFEYVPMKTYLAMRNEWHKYISRVLEEKYHPRCKIRSFIHMKGLGRKKHTRDYVKKWLLNRFRLPLHTVPEHLQYILLMVFYRKKTLYGPIVCRVEQQPYRCPKCGSTDVTVETMFSAYPIPVTWKMVEEGRFSFAGG